MTVMPSAALDNDILYKASWFGLIQELLATVPVTLADAVVLGEAKYVLAGKVKRDIKKRREGAKDVGARLAWLLERIATAEPTKEETRFAAELENRAAAAGVALDSGESLLCAIVIRRDLDRLATGDKRAICALEALLDTSPELKPIGGKVVCIEQLFLGLLETRDPAGIREAVCANPEVDRALALSFSCSSPEVPADHCATGLRSYVLDLEKQAPSILLRSVPEEDSVG